MRRAIGISFLLLLLAGVSAQDAIDWGTVIPTTDGLQADSWVARLKGPTVVDTPLFEAADPTFRSTPNAQSAGPGLISLNSGGQQPIGKASAPASHAFRNAYPRSISGQEKLPALGVSYAESSFAAIDIGLPYIQNPTGGIPLSAVGVHLEACRAIAVSVPGKPVRLHGGCGRGYISVGGKKIIDISPSVSPNFEINIPESEPRVAFIILNEQVTTDNNGNPTTDNNGDYRYDPKATSGYVNAIRIVYFGVQQSEEITVGHAAVIRDASKSDALASNLPPPPPFLHNIIND